ncbi:MAG TPA: class I SAM-dependent methyltransferase [Trebonia sp.]
MREGTASRTARSVAARRLEYERAASPYGNPAADDALTRDVAGGLTPSRNRMHEYIRARTAFFDRVVVDAIGRDIAQVVIGGAGYDGRALRYGAPGVRWFEVDHPATQADKRERLDRLGVDTAGISFIPADFTADPVAQPLLKAGLDPARPALFLFEGVAVYLEEAVTGRVLAGFRSVTVDGSPLAISVSVGQATSQTRARFQQRVAEMGEPARTVLTAEQAAGLLAAAGWELAEGSSRQRSAGLLLARAASTEAHPERERPAQARPESLPAQGAADRGSATRPAVTGTVAGGTTATTGTKTAATGTAGTASTAARVPVPVTRQQAARLPLSALLSQTLVAFTIEADNEAEHRFPHRTTSQGKAGAWSDGAWLTSLLMWANCLRHLPDAGLTIAELRERARTSTNLDGVRRWGYVTFTPDPGHGKRPSQDALITPTAQGRLARDTWPGAVADVESRWRMRLGADAYERLRAALAAVTGNLDPALPDCLPILGHGLRSRPDRGRTARTARPGPAGAVSAGTEPAAGQPLWALLSRPLLAFTLRYERAPGPSLAVSANILRVLTEADTPVKDIPALSGVSKESVAMAVGWLREAGIVTEGPDPAGGRFRQVRLTRRGALARDQYPALAGGIEADWRARFGAAAVPALRAALEPLAAGDPPPLFAGLEPYPDNWRARVKPPAVLPHYPMTLHRGGYPDGS